MPDTPDVSIDDDEPLVIESVTWLDGRQAVRKSPVRKPSVAAWAVERLTAPGILALGGGLATLWCFLLPWFVMPAGYMEAAPGGEVYQANDGSWVPYPAWSMASGLSLPGNGYTIDLVLFVHLWLVPLAAVALVVVAWYATQRRLGTRATAGCVLALAALTLLVEIGYYVQVRSFTHVLPPGVGAVGWGFWLAVIVSVATGAVAVQMLRPAADVEPGTAEAGEE